MSRSLALLGLPHAGKSAWLGRLWLAVEAGRRQLRKREAPADLTPLRLLADTLQEGRFPDRTSTTAPPTFYAPLTWGDTPLDLHVADYNGEEVNAVWDQRDVAWSPAWDARATCSGLAIVIRADKNLAIRSTRLEAVRPEPRTGARLFPAHQPDDDTTGRGVEPGVPAAVSIVELLQLLRHARGLAPGERDRGWRVAVVLTAWDAVPEEARERGPVVFLRERLGLLDDALATNFEAEDVRVFGLSAVGGDIQGAYAGEFARGEVDDHGWVAWDRDGVRCSGDVTLPIGWLLLGDDALPDGEPCRR